MLAFDLPDTRTRDSFWKGCYEFGLIVIRSGERSIRLRPVLDLKGDIVEASARLMARQCRKMES
jgi:L-lysine 6-transaminase